MSLRSNTKILRYLAFVFLFLLSTSSCDLLNSKDNTANEPDTTSSNFVWTVDTLGNMKAKFYDLAIVDTNDIWISGKISAEVPETGKWKDYNAIHWDGDRWSNERILTTTYYGSESFSRPIDAITIFSDDYLWFFSEAGGYTEYRNNRWYSRPFNATPGEVQEVISPTNNLAFIAGNVGNITKWKNKEFEKLSTGLQSDIKGIAYANDTLKFGTEYTLRQYVDGQIVPEYSPDAPEAFRLEGRYYDIWHSGEAWWYATSKGLYRFSPDSGYVQMTNRAVYYIAGNGENDIVAVDKIGEDIYHWNGNTMSRFDFPKIPRDWFIYIEGIDMFGDQIKIVGWGANTFSSGFIITGQRE